MTSTQRPSVSSSSLLGSSMGVRWPNSRKLCTMGAGRGSWRCASSSAMYTTWSAPSLVSFCRRKETGWSWFWLSSVVWRYDVIVLESWLFPVKMSSSLVCNFWKPVSGLVPCDGSKTWFSSKNKPQPILLREANRRGRCTSYDRHSRHSHATPWSDSLYRVKTSGLARVLYRSRHCCAAVLRLFAQTACVRFKTNEHVGLSSVYLFVSSVLVEVAASTCRRKMCLQSPVSVPSPLMGQGKIIFLPGVFACRIAFNSSQTSGTRSRPRRDPPRAHQPSRSK